MYINMKTFHSFVSLRCVVYLIMLPNIVSMHVLMQFLTSRIVRTPAVSVVCGSLQFLGVAG